MKIVAVLGDYYHKEAPLRDALSEAVSNIEGIDLLYTTRQNLLEKLEENPDLVVLASENRLEPDKDVDKKWLTKSEEHQITEYVKHGGNWFTWHSGLAGYEENDAYVSMLGGYFTHHPDEHVDVRYRYKENHVLSDEKDPFVIKDEHYFIERVGECSYFLESLSMHGTSDAGWTKRHGEGKVCCYIPAHNKEGLMDGSVQRDLSDIIKWFSQ